MSRMTRILRISEFIWLGITALSLIEAVQIINSGSDKSNRLYLFAGFALLGILMFWFRRKMRRKMEKRNPPDEAA